MKPVESASPAAGADGEPAVVMRSLPNGMFRLRTGHGLEIDAHVASALRMAMVRLLPGDRVLISQSPFDRGKARIIGFPRLEQSQNETNHHPIPKRELS
jgi:translation initiation factor IF-1